MRESERLDASYIVMVRMTSAKQFDAAASMTSLCRGGPCFVSTLNRQQGDKVDIDLPSTQPVATRKARVILDRPQRDKFSVGTEFVGMKDARRARSIEMHRAIYTYQKMNYASGDTQ